FHDALNCAHHRRLRARRPWDQRYRSRTWGAWAYGAALAWPEPPGGAGHKPGRKAGSLVVLVDGELVLYLERGGKSLLAWAAEPDDPALTAACGALAGAARAGRLGTITVERANGDPALTSPLARTLEAAGFVPTPKGLRLRP
ncbi:hypothetical protein ACWC9H_34085, partial [Streptomyces sp. NPDC001251]